MELILRIKNTIGITIYLSIAIISSFLFGSCNDCEDKNLDVRFENPVVHIGYVDDSLKKSFSNYIFRLGVDELYGNNLPDKNVILYNASMWPGCEIKLIYNRLNLLDSIQVFSDKNYNSITGLDVTDIFQNYNHKKLNEKNTGWITDNFFLIQPPTINDTFKFTFRFFDSRDTIIEFQTRRIFITQ